MKYTHGNRQLIIQFGIKIGECCLATCLHRLFKHLNDESATITYAFPYLSALAAPILLPHNTTL